MKKNKQPRIKNTTASFEIEFYEKLLKDKPDYVEALIPLAEAYTKAGKYNNGLSVDKRLALLKSDDATVYYNLACSYSLLEQVNDAFIALKKAVALGYKDFNHLDNDPDLFHLRDDKRYQEMISEIIKQKGVENEMGRTT